MVIQRQVPEADVRALAAELERDQAALVLAADVIAGELALITALVQLRWPRH